MTVSGLFLGDGSDYRCRFGNVPPVNATLVMGGSLQCVSPAMSENSGSSAMALEVSPNAQQYTNDHRIYFVHGAANISRIHPVAGPTAGGTLIFLRGSNLSLGTRYICRFAQVGDEPASALTVYATLANASQVQCRSPLANATLYAVTISLNAQQFLPVEPALLFSFYEPPRVTEVSPSSGSALGGTVVTVMGSKLRYFSEHAPRCKFGTALAEATFDDSSSLRCVSPASPAAGAAQYAIVDFSSALAAHGELRGDAQVRAGVLQLTPAEYFQTGAYILDVGVPEREIAWFRLGAYVSIGGGARNVHTPLGGLGLSVSFGLLPDTAFGELGAGSGLRVCVLTGNSSMSVHVAGRNLGSTYIGSIFERSDRFAHLQIEYANGTLSIAVDSTSVFLISSVSLVGNAAWRFGFGARTGLNHDAHVVDNITLEAGSFVRPEAVNVEVTLNHEAFSSGSVPFTYLPPPSVSRLSIDRGPIAGGTLVVVYGTSFTGASHPRCRFGNVTVLGTVQDTGSVASGSLICNTPMHNVSGSVSFEVALNGKDYTANGQSFNFYHFTISSTTPMSGPILGGTLITMRMHGEGLDAGDGGHSSACAFAAPTRSDHFQVLASQVSAEQLLRCESPSFVVPAMPNTTRVDDGIR